MARRHRQAVRKQRLSGGLDRQSGANHIVIKSPSLALPCTKGTLVRPPKDGCRRRQSLLSLSPIFFALSDPALFQIGEGVAEALQRDGNANAGFRRVEDNEHGGLP